MPTGDLERKLVVYEWRCPDDPPSFDRLTAANALARLPDDGTRKCPRGAFAADVLLADEGTLTTPTQVVVLRLRDYDNRPYMRRPGGVPSPVVIARDADIVDASHGLIWGDNIAAFALGGYGPPPSYLGDFLFERIGQSVVFDPLFDRTLIQRLQQLRGIRALEVRIRNSHAIQGVQDAQLGPFSGLFRHFQGQSDEVVLTQQLRLPSRGRGARRAILTSVRPEDVLAMASEADRLYDTFLVTGINAEGRIEHIDLVNERLHTSVRLPRSRRGGHYTDDTATFAALTQARAELEADGRLQQAATSRATGT